MSDQRRGRSRRAAAINHSVIQTGRHEAPSTPEMPPLPAPPPPPQQRLSPSLPASAAAAASSAAAPAAAASDTGSTPRRRTIQNSVPVAAGTSTAATQPTPLSAGVPTSVQLDRRSRSPGVSAASSLSFAVAAGAAAMDIDNASISTTGTAGTLGTVVQDGDNLIESLGTADLKKTGDGGDSDCEHEDGQLFISERDEDNIFEPAEKIIEDDDVDNDELPPMLIGVPDGWEKPGPPRDSVLPRLQASAVRANVQVSATEPAIPRR